MRANKVGRRSFQPCEVRVSQGFEYARAVVHPVANAVGDDDIARNAERRHVALGLLKCALDARAQTLGLDHESAVCRRAGQLSEDRDIDVAPFHCQTLRGPTESAQERHDEMHDQLVLARQFTKALCVLQQRKQIGGLRDEHLECLRHARQRRFLGRQLRKCRSLPMCRRRVHKACRKVHDLFVPNPRAPRRVGAEGRTVEMVFRGQPPPIHAPRVLEIPAVHVIKRVEIHVIARHDPDRGDPREPRAQQYHASRSQLGCETPHVIAIKHAVVAIGRPGTGIARADQCNAVPQKDVGVGSGRRTGRDLPDGRHRGTASSIASSRRFSSLSLG